MFNQLMEQKSTTAQLGVSIKLSIAQLDCWKYEHLKKYYQSNVGLKALGEIIVLRYIAEAGHVLLLDKNLLKERKILDSQICYLKKGQLYWLLMRFQPDDYSPSKVPGEVMESLKGDATDGEKVKLEQYPFYSIFLSV